MQTDRYTKCILTVIAISLAVLAADTLYESMVPEAQAASGMQCKVGYSITKCAPVVVGKLY